MEGVFLATCEKCGCEYEGYYTHCPGCGSLIDADNDFTFQCGNCLRLVPDNAKRCPYCGIEFPQSGNTPKNRGSKTKSSTPAVYESESSSRTVYEGDIIKLAKRATPELQYKLGSMYEECDSDYITAYKLFLMAAEKDHAHHACGLHRDVHKLPLRPGSVLAVQQHPVHPPAVLDPAQG